MAATSTVRRLSTNILLLFGSSIFSAATGFLFAAIAARRLGAELFGQLSTAQILVLALVTVTEFGLTNVVTREVARNRGQTEPLAANVIAIKLLLGLAAYLCAAVIAAGAGYAPATRALILINALALVPIAVSMGCAAIFGGHEQFIYGTASTVANAAANLIGAGLILLGSNLQTVVAVYVIAASAAAGFSLIVLRWRYAVHTMLAVDRSLWGRLFRAAWPFAATGLISMVGVSAGPLMLARLSGETALGYYSVANKLIQVFIILVGAYNSAVFPVFSRLKSSSQANLLLGYRVSMKIIVISGLAIGAVVWISADSIITWLFPAYESAVPILQVLGWYTCVTLVATVPLNIMYAEGRQRETALIALVGAMLTLSLNALLIPKFGGVAVALALIAFSATPMVACFWLLRKTYPLAMLPLLLQAALVAALVAGVGALLSSVHIVVSLAAQGLAFLVIVTRSGIFDREDIAILRQIPLVARVLPRQV